MKISKKISEAAAEMFGSNTSFSELFVNKDGEFFTNQNLAINSVKGKKSDYARILKSNVISEEEVEDKKDALETVKKVEGVMTVIADDKTEITFPNVKDEIREPVEGDEALIDGKPAEGAQVYNGSKLEFKAGKLVKITYKKEGTRSVFSKFLGGN